MNSRNACGISHRKWTWWLSSNPGCEALCFLLCAYALGKGTDPSLIPPAMGK